MSYTGWTGRTIGVEIELTRTTTQGGALTEAMLRAALQRAVPAGRLNTARASYYHSTGSTWDVKTDASCGWEVATPALSLDETGHNAELRAGCQAIAALRPSITNACGLHVHIACRDFTWQHLRDLLKLWVRYEPFFYGMVPPSRQQSPYCAPHRSVRWQDGASSFCWQTVDRAMAATSEREFNRHAQLLDRRMALNLSGWWRHGRVEIRLHSGTCYYDKIRRWSMLMVALCNRVKQTQMPVLQRGGGYAIRPLTAAYVGKVLGLLPTQWLSDPHPEGAVLVRWMQRRYDLFVPRGMPVPRPRPRPQPSAPAAPIPSADQTIAAAIDAALRQV